MGDAAADASTPSAAIFAAATASAASAAADAAAATAVCVCRRAGLCWLVPCSAHLGGEGAGGLPGDSEGAWLCAYSMGGSDIPHFQV